jgi:hypothetical protein
LRLAANIPTSRDEGAILTEGSRGVSHRPGTQLQISDRGVAERQFADEGSRSEDPGVSYEDFGQPADSVGLAVHLLDHSEVVGLGPGRPQSLAGFPSQALH